MEPDRRMLDILLPLSQLPGVTLTGAMAHALEQMKKCRTAENGGRVLYCPQCHTKIVLYNPCNKRGCPICYKKNQLQWQKRTEHKILATTHYHLTFSIPEIYTGVWIQDPKAVMNSLFAAVKNAIKVVEEDSGLLLGSLQVFQSHGRGMAYKPHMHCVLSGGGLDSNKQWVELERLPIRKMEQETKERFENELRAKLPGDRTVQAIRSKIKQYRVYVSKHVRSGQSIIQYLAKSRNGVVIDMGQEFSIDEESIEFREIDNGVERTTRLSKKTFIERYLKHIPPEGFVVTRYYGLYSNRHKNDLRIAREQIGDVEEEYKPYKELCPKCETEMVVVEIIAKEDKQLCFRYGDEQGPPEHGVILSVA